MSTPKHLTEKAVAVSLDLLPTKSKEKYLSCYDKFVKWKEAEGATSWSEDVLLSYFAEELSKYAPTTMWSIYSMLKTTISSKHNVDISKYCRLQAFLKKKRIGFASKKSKVSSPTEINKFLREAPDREYLLVKVVAILGVLGACRGAELCDMAVADFEDLEKKLLKITIPTTKTHISRTFTVEGEYYEIIKKYASLRPKNAESSRFFLNYQKGKCTKQIIGKNKVATCPKQIAEFLNLPNSGEYTGHSFRRTSATLLADSGADITTIKRHGGWKSTTVAEGYIQDSTSNKRKISNQITKCIDESSPRPSLDHMAFEKKIRSENFVSFSTKTEESNLTTKETVTSKPTVYNFQNCTINTINF
ncbi:hypothetical protein RN001_003572 [Aquatica leii]|uniref:Tyr recombinase domain-containing protein n=1 Tax=Aquatica leii TaxID=1421715 RepID=A0AAN7PR91_9COLE|nr:hypothetical protein RN001_003572 [Aquatica leii]